MPDRTPATGTPWPVGLEDGTVRVVPYASAWSDVYRSEVARITPYLEVAGVTLIVEHTGSTAIPGMPAKPIIDILALRHGDDERRAAIAALQQAGYTFRGENGIPGRDFFRRGTPRQFHIHLVRADSVFCDDHRTFRDHLRTHPAAAAGYAALKQSLAVRHATDREAYIEGKTAFVYDVLRTARSAR